MYLTYSPQHAQDHVVDAFYPYRAIAEAVRSIQAEPRNIAGSRYLVAGLACYLPNHPKPYFDWETRHSPWLNDELIKREGAVFAWEVKDPHTQAIPDAIQVRFDSARFIGTQSFQTTNPRQDHAVIVAFAELLPH